MEGRARGKRERGREKERERRSEGGRRENTMKTEKWSGGNEYEHTIS